MNSLRQFFSNSSGELVIVQSPNLAIIIFVGFKLLSFITDDQLASAFQIGADVSLLVWAGLELFQGDSRFRQLLGLVVAGAVIMTRLM